jgi:wyosine [tRNA(Phe)-imidazoG37] synthetase (radical SAM superfamily)
LPNPAFIGIEPKIGCKISASIAKNSVVQIVSVNSLYYKTKSNESNSNQMIAPHTTAVARRSARCDARGETAFGCPRDFLENRFVYVVISPRARGLSVGINMNPDKKCNYDCVYCEVDRSFHPAETRVDLGLLESELKNTFELVRSGKLRKRTPYIDLPPDLLKLRHVTLSGDGEPTLCPEFADIVQTVVHFRAREGLPFFKIVLITNATGFDRPEISRGLQCILSRDEVWVKLEAGTQEYMNQVNRTTVRLEEVMKNILTLGRRRPIIIQSLFSSIAGQPPHPKEIDAYTQRLLELKNAGAQISLVQIYSATRPGPHSECGHLPLKFLSTIAKKVRDTAGLKAEVF